MKAYEISLNLKNFADLAGFQASVYIGYVGVMAADMVITVRRAVNAYYLKLIYSTGSECARIILQLTPNADVLSELVPSSL